MKSTTRVFLFLNVTAAALLAVAPLRAANFGIDAVHGFDAAAILATGSDFSTFRSVITGQGHTITPLNTFTAASLAPLDAVILMTPYNVNAAPYTAANINAITAFANRRAVFVSDQTLWSNASTGSDRPITFGDNQELLQNIVAYLSSGRGALFIGDNGNGFNPANMNSLIASYGISYSASPTDGLGRTVTGFVPHPVTAGLSQIGVDFQLAMTIGAPSLDLTIGVGQDNILAVFEVPEPAVASILVAIGASLAVRPGTRRSRRLAQSSDLEAV